MKFNFEQGMSQEDLKNAFEEQKKNLSVSVVEVNDLAKKEAEQAADEAISIEKEELEKRNKSFLKKAVARIKFGMMREYKRHTALSKAEKDIVEGQNLYAGSEDFEDAEDAVKKAKSLDDLKSVAQRFAYPEISSYLNDPELQQVLDGSEGSLIRTAENEEVYEVKNENHNERKEKKIQYEQLQKNIKSLIFKFANGELNDQSLREAINRDVYKYLDDRFGGKDGFLSQKLRAGNMYADNILDVAGFYKAYAGVAESLKEEEIDFKFTLGRAKSAIKTEYHRTAAENIVDRLGRTRVGNMLPDGIVAAGVLTGSYLLKGALRRGAAAGLSVVGGMAVGAALNAYREKNRLKQERQQHLRDLARGKADVGASYEDMGKRKNFQESSYAKEMISARATIENLRAYSADLYEGGARENGLKADAIDQVSYDTIVAALSDLEYRVTASDSHKKKNNIDLIAFSSPTDAQQERLEIDILRAQLKVDLRKLQEAGQLDNLETGLSDGQDINQLIRSGSFVQAKISGLESKISESDNKFREYMSDRVKKKMLESVAFGVGIGAVSGAATYLFGHATGLTSAIRMEKDDIPGGLNEKPTKAFWPIDDPNTQGAGELEGPKLMIDHDIETTRIEGTNDWILRRTADDGTVIEDFGTITFEFNPDGTMTAETEAQLNALTEGMQITDSGPIETSTTSVEEVEQSVDTYVDQKIADGEMINIERTWFDNDTAVFDRNELDLRWGGDKGVVYNPDGSVKGYSFDISTFLEGDSFRGTDVLEIQNSLDDGSLKLLLSMSDSTQAAGFPITIDSTTKQAFIDIDSDAAKNLFEVNASGEAVYKGGYVEVGKSLGNDKWGIAATYNSAGSGIDTVVTTEQVTRTEITHEYSVDFPPEGYGKGNDDWIPPFFYMPMTGREEMQKLKKKPGDGFVARTPFGPAWARPKQKSEEEKTGGPVIPFVQPGMPVPYRGAELPVRYENKEQQGAGLPGQYLGGQEANIGGDGFTEYEEISNEPKTPGRGVVAYDGSGRAVGEYNPENARYTENNAGEERGPDYDPTTPFENAGVHLETLGDVERQKVTNLANTFEKFSGPMGPEMRSAFPIPLIVKPGMSGKEYADNIRAYIERTKAAGGDGAVAFDKTLEVSVLVASKAGDPYPKDVVDAIRALRDEYKGQFNIGYVAERFESSDLSYEKLDSLLGNVVTERYRRRGKVVNPDGTQVGLNFMRPSFEAGAESGSESTESSASAEGSAAEAPGSGIPSNYSFFEGLSAEQKEAYKYRQFDFARDYINSLESGYKNRIKGAAETIAHYDKPLGDIDTMVGFTLPGVESVSDPAKAQELITSYVSNLVSRVKRPGNVEVNILIPRAPGAPYPQAVIDQVKEVMKGSTGVQNINYLPYEFPSSELQSESLNRFLMDTLTQRYVDRGPGVVNSRGAQRSVNIQVG